MRAAIVGAGPSGLTTARHAVLNGFDVEIFDKRNAVGGRWSLDSLNGPFLHNETKMQYSATICAFSDFPRHSRRAMTKLEAGEYLSNYAQQFNLNKLVQLNTEVVGVRRHYEYEKEGTWEVTYRKNGSDDLTTDVFDVVLGRISHAADFKSTIGYSNKIVVLVGFGNSAAEIARRLGSVAKKIYICSRRKEWTWRQVNPDGRQFDLSHNNRINHVLRSVTPKYLRNFIWERQSNFNYGGKRPDHRFLATLPVFVDGLEELLNSGRLEVEENLLSFTVDGVEFKSGRSIDHVDEVIFCTGYQFDFNVIEDGYLVGVHDNDFQMYLHMWPVELRKHPTLACIGFVQPQLGSIWPLAELQARLFFSVHRGTFQLPPTFDMRRDAEYRRCCMNLNFLRTRRHTHIEDFVGFSNELSKMVGARPSWTTLISDPQLAWHYFTGPLTSYQHRLAGPNSCPEARDAVISASKHASRTHTILLNFFLFFLITAILLKMLLC